MSEARELIARGVEAFRDLVHRVPDSQWNAPTPCTEWNVRDLVNHMINEHSWAPHLLRGETMVEVGDRYDGDLTGDDPVAAWDAAESGSVPAFAAASDDGVVHCSYGDTTVRNYSEEMLTDLTVHAWDLARGAGLPDRIDPVLVEHVLRFTEGRGLSPSPYFKAPVAVDSDDPQARLLGLLGRTP